jgi:hypothetical protein
MKINQDRINHLWNNLVSDVYEEWKTFQMRNDDFLKWLDDSELDAELISELADVYVEYSFGYEVFLDSEENLTLLSITKSSSSSDCHKESV